MNQNMYCKIKSPGLISYAGNLKLIADSGVLRLLHENAVTKKYILNFKTSVWIIKEQTLNGTWKSLSSIDWNITFTRIRVHKQGELPSKNFYFSIIYQKNGRKLTIKISHGWVRKWRTKSKYKMFCLSADFKNHTKYF